MKLLRIPSSVLLLLLALVAFAFSTGAQRTYAAPGSPVAVVASFTKVKGDQAVAWFEKFSPDRCIETNTVVLGARGLLTQNTGQTLSQLGSVTIGEVNLCTGTTLIEAVGTINTGVNLSVNSSLTSGSLAMTVPVLDDISGRIIRVSVNLRWSGIGKLQTGNITSHDGDPRSFVTNTHFLAQFRTATASGTVSDGTTNFTPTASKSAELDRSSDGEITIQRS